MPHGEAIRLDEELKSGHNDGVWRLQNRSDRPLGCGRSIVACRFPSSGIQMRVACMDFRCEYGTDPLINS